MASDALADELGPAAAAGAEAPSGIDELDPSLVEGHRSYYEREVPFEIRAGSGVDSDADGAGAVGSLEAVRVKILILGDEAAPESIRVELSSESNLFFHFVHDLDADSYAELQESQKLMVEFAEYPTVLLRMLNSCIKEPHTHLAVFNVEAEEGGSRLDFICNMEYKFVELLSLNFEESSEDLVRQHVTFRYNAVKSRLAMMQARLADVNAIVRVKNPSLLLTLQQSAGASAGPKKGVGR